MDTESGCFSVLCSLPTRPGDNMEGVRGVKQHLMVVHIGRFWAHDL